MERYIHFINSALLLLSSIVTAFLSRPTHLVVTPIVVNQHTDPTILAYFILPYFIALFYCLIVFCLTLCDTSCFCWMRAFQLFNSLHPRIKLETLYCTGMTLRLYVSVLVSCYSSIKIIMLRACSTLCGNCKELTIFWTHRTYKMYQICVLFGLNLSTWAYM